MRGLVLAGALAVLLGGCGATTQNQTEAAGSDLSRQLRVAAAAERGGQIDVALQIYTGAAQANPGNAEVAARHAGLLMLVGNPDAALQALAEARRRNPDDTALLLMEGRALLELGRAPDALALFERRLRSAPADSAALNGKGVALDMLGRHADARAAYRAAHAADPRNPLWAGNFALSLILSGCPAQAATLLEATPRGADTGPWLSQLQTLARNLATPGATVPPELRQAMPASPEPCPAGV
jgi:Flp pilus assembly protein TadD